MTQIKEKQESALDNCLLQLRDEMNKLNSIRYIAHSNLPDHEKVFQIKEVLK